MMNGPPSLHIPERASARRAAVGGGVVRAASGVSSPVHSPAVSSHQTNFLRSLHGRPSGLADARL